VKRSMYVSYDDGSFISERPAHYYKVGSRFVYIISECHLIHLWTKIYDGVDAMAYRNDSGAGCRVALGWSERFIN
jgi:hypothetical protein